MPRGGEELGESELRGVRATLRRSLKAVERILRGKSQSDFEQFTALQKKQAIENELARLERQIPERIVRGVGQVSQALASRRGAATPGAPVPVAVDAALLARAGKSAGKEIVGVSNEVRRDVNRATLKVLSGQIDRAQYEQEIRQAFDGDVLEGRVERIARTEISRAMGEQKQADFQALQDLGADLVKRWVSSGKGPGRERENHAAIDGQERELDEEFNLGDGATAATPPGSSGVRARFPVDPNLPPEEAVNCGCTVVTIPRSQARQPYIAKVPRTDPGPRSAPS